MLVIFVVACDLTNVVQTLTIRTQDNITLMNSF